MTSLSELDAEFEQQLDEAKGILDQMTSTKNRLLCVKYLKRLCNLHSIPLASVKKDRNRFMKFFLTLMRQSIKLQPKLTSNDKSFQSHSVPEKEHSEYSDDRKTYFATKVIPGYGILVYMATLNDDSEWQEYGFLDYEF